MRAVVCHAITPDLSGIGIRELPMPAPDPDQVRVKVRAAGVNFPDILLCQGRYQLRLDPPFTPGMEVAGEVDALGEAVDRFKVGDAVVGTMRSGAFAEQVFLDKGALRLKPSHLSFSEAAAYPTAYLAAYVALVRRAGLRAGETVLVHGASGGVGLAAVDLAKVLGATVIATSASDAKLEVVAAYGADHTVNVSRGFADEVKRLTGGRGAEVIFDPVGGDVFDESTRCIAFDGRLLVVGFTSGRFATLRSNIVLIKGFSVLGVRAGEYGRRFPDKGRENVRAIWQLALSGKTRPRVHAELPLERARDAFELLLERAAIGKVVLRCDR